MINDSENGNSNKWGWLIVFSSFMIHFIMDGVNYSMGQVYLELMRQKLSLSRAPVSSIFSILSAVSLGAGPIATVFTNFYGCRKTAMFGTCIASLGFFLSRWWANIWFYYMTIGIIGGVGFSLMYLPAIVSIGLYFEEKRSLAMGIAVCGSGVGTFVLSYVMNAIVNIYSWIDYPTALLVESAIILSYLICGFFMIPLPQEPSEQRRRQQKLCKEATQQHSSQLLMLQNVSSTSNNKSAVIDKSLTKSFYHQIRQQIDLNILKDPSFALFSITIFLSSLGFNVVYYFADDLANDSKVMKEHRPYIIMSIAVSNIFGRIIFGYLGDRKQTNRLFLFILSIVLQGVATLVAPLCGASILPHVAYAITFGFFSGGAVTLSAIIPIDLVGISKLSDSFGILLLLLGIATAVGTPVAGAMRDAFSHFPRPFLWPYFMFGILMIFGGMILFVIPVLQRRSTKKSLTKNHRNTIQDEQLDVDIHNENAL